MKGVGGLGLGFGRVCQLLGDTDLVYCICVGGRTRHAHGSRVSCGVLCEQEKERLCARELYI